MSDVFRAVPVGMDGFATLHHDAGDGYSAAASADSAAVVGAVAAALGAIGAPYLAAFAPAMANNLAATMCLADVHHATGGATESGKATFVAHDNA